MRCTWKNLARHCYSPAQQSPGFLTALNHWSGRKYATTATSRRSSSSPTYTSSSNHSSSSRNALADSSILDNGGIPLTGPQQLSAAQLARAAAQAIRLSVNAGNLSDAFSILNSLYSASVPPANLTANLPSKHRILINAIRIHSSHQGRVSPRLPAHSLLHALIRTGNIAPAAQLSEQIFAAGMKVRTCSMAAVIAGLGRAGVQVFEHQGYTTPKLHTRPILSTPTHILPLPSQLSFFTAVRPKKTVGIGRRDADATSQNLKQADGPSIQNLAVQPSHLTNSVPTQFALRLVDLARHSRQQRTRTFFTTLITLCLINGEIILASLVFGLLIRDWQSRTTSAAVKEGNNNSGVKGSNVPDSPCPHFDHLYDICRTISVSLEAHPYHLSPRLLPAHVRQPDNNHQDEPMPRQAALQALANLVYILEQDTEGFPNLAPLIKILGKYVQSARRFPVAQKEYVWVSSSSDQGAALVEASRYFEGILLGMMHSLPILPTSVRQQVPDLQSHNSFLHFILYESSVAHQPERVREYAKYVFGSLHSHYNGGDKATSNICRRYKGCLKDLEDIRLIVPEELPTLIQHIQSESEPSPYCLSTEITHLNSIGQPQEVVDALDLLLPGLSLESRTAHTDDPSSPSQSPLIQRVITLGPYVLTCILEALRNLGKTGTADKVWRLAREAERVSLLGDAKPFVIPIQAYTIMMCIYGDEARNTGPRGQQNVRRWGIGAHSHTRRIARPKYVPDYGSRAHTQHNRRRTKVLKLRKQMTRRQMGLYMCIRLYIETTAREQQLRDACMASIQAGRSLKPPVLDALFFDALLRIIRKPSSPEGVPGHYVKRALTYHRRQLRLAKRVFAFTGRRVGSRAMVQNHPPSDVLEEQPTSRQLGKLTMRDIIDNKGNAYMHTLLLHIITDMQRRDIPVPLVFSKAVVGWIDGVGLPEGVHESRRRVWVEKTTTVLRRRRGKRKWIVRRPKRVPKSLRL